MRACSKVSRTRAAPTPTNISTKSEPLILKKGTFASPATARARSVLPVPGGPTIKIPFGIDAPILVKRLGSRRKSTISFTSSFASSHPATSLKVVPSFSFAFKRARDFANCIAPLFALRKKRYIIYSTKPEISKVGRTL